MSFYREYINYMNGELSGSDSLEIMALAQLCPEINGIVVYQARALYSFIYSDLSIFNDDSCISADSTYIAEKHSNHQTISNNGNSSKQDYTLLPNPNDGNFTILQSIKDELPVNAEIRNIMGICIYKGSLTFNGWTDKLQMINATPGLYLLTLTDTKGQKFICKFVVQ